MKLGWYINRLRSMEPAEVLHRLREKRSKIVSRRSHQGWKLYPARDLHPVLPQLRDTILAATPSQRQAIAAAAENTFAGNFSALGRTWPPRDPADLFPASLWRLDPMTGTAWPDAKTYAFDIDFRHDGRRGDIKYVWEINRLQILPALATHSLLSDDKRCLTAIETAIDSWFIANPPFGGVGWASGIEVALRAISLIVTLSLVGDRLSDNTRQQLSRILTASAFWLPRFPSKFSSANNHLVAELAGEYLLAIALGTDPTPARTALLAELQKQILPDGAGAEQTPTYAAFTAELVLLCALAARQAGASFPPACDQRLAAFADFIAWLPPHSGSFGDDDEGRVLTLGDEPNYARSVASSIHGFLHQPGIAPAPDDFRALIFGAPSQQAPASHGLRTFPQGGLSVWHGDIASRHIDLTFDHGPLGYLSIAAHGHADALALTLDIDGQPVLVDPGTWLYGSGGIWRDWFRSTPAHNTLNIAGTNQSLIAGAFNWSHKAVSNLLESTPEPDWHLRAQHDGYRQRFGTLHQRTVSRQNNAITITDQLLGTTHDAEIVFQLAPDLVPIHDHNTVTIHRGDEPLLAIHFPDPAITLSVGGETPGKGGWVSPRFGIKLPAHRLAWRGKVGEGGVITRLVPLAPKAL